MRFLFPLTIVISILCLASCKGSNPATGSVTVAPSPAASVPAAAQASPMASIMAKPGSKVPPGITEPWRRALTDAEIERMPPATRDMIKRAQGKLPPTPAPKK